MIQKTLIILLASAALLAVRLAEGATVTVFAAASLAESLKQIAAEYGKSSGDKIVFNFAASGQLARQIEEGAPADIFFSADEARADALEKKGLLAPDTRVRRLGNSLVIVTSLEAAPLTRPDDLTHAAFRRIALGDMKTVPAGTYAKAYLQKQGIWPALSDKVVPCENVRAVLAAVESGNVEAGIVYKSDAAISRKVKIALAVPAAEGPKITYPMAMVRKAREPEAARKFLGFLNSSPAALLFQKAGFIVLEPEPVP